MDKRLYRSSHNRVFLGVCGGMGEYFNTDPVIIRVIAVIITVLTGFLPGIIAYVIIALVIPQEGSTVSNPEDNIRDNIHDMRDTTVRMGQDLQSSLRSKSTNSGSPRSTGTNSGAIILGLLIIALGIFFLIDNVIGWFWRFTWPALLIVGGLIIVLLVVRRK
jgi:phage shock protein C